MKPLSALTLALTALALTSAGAATYTFNALANGPIAGQDNWVVLAGSGDSSDVIQNAAAFIPNAANTTNVMANPGPPGPTGVHRMARTNDGNYSFGNLAGATGLTLSFDTQVYNNAFGDITDFINFGLATVNDTNSSPVIAFNQQGNGPAQVAYGAGVAGNTFNLPNTPTGDWIQLSLVANFTTNLGSITYQDLSLGGPVIQIANNLSMGGTGANAALWTTMWSRSDNLGGGNSHVVIDNLTVTPSFAAVPEVNGAWIAGACALLLTGHFVRRRSRSRHAMA